MVSIFRAMPWRPMVCRVVVCNCRRQGQPPDQPKRYLSNARSPSQHKVDAIKFYVVCPPRRQFPKVKRVIYKVRMHSIADDGSRDDKLLSNE